MQDRRTDFVVARGPVPRSSRITGEFWVRSTPSRVPGLALVGLPAAAAALWLLGQGVGVGGGEGGVDAGFGANAVQAGAVLVRGASGDRAARAGDVPRPHPLAGEWFEIEPSGAEWGNAAERERAAEEGPPAGRRERVVGNRERSAGPPARAAVQPERSAQQEHPAGRRGHSTGPHHEFYFTRAQYTGIGRGWRASRAWATDFPKADQQFVYGVRRLSYVDAYQLENPVRLDAPELRRYPFLYAVEVGHMALTDAEVEGLRNHLEAGGFLVVDDFWGPYEWENFEYNMRRVLPGRPIVDITLDHPLYSSFYQIDEIVQVPNVWNGRRGGPTAECRGCEPAVRGIFDDDGRLMVLIHFNTDLGDAWEWADDPLYPIRYSTYAYQVGVNMIIYAMSH